MIEIPGTKRTRTKAALVGKIFLLTALTVAVATDFVAILIKISIEKCQKTTEISTDLSTNLTRRKLLKCGCSFFYERLLIYCLSVGRIWVLFSYGWLNIWVSKVIDKQKTFLLIVVRLLFCRNLFVYRRLDCFLFNYKCPKWASFCEYLLNSSVFKFYFYLLHFTFDILLCQRESILIFCPML